MRKVIILFLSLAGLTTESASQSQSVRQYTCWVDDSREVMKFKFGPGELRELRGGTWSVNLCEVFDGTCQFKGSAFYGDGDGFTFRLDTLKGRYYFFDESMDNEVRGQCHPWISGSE